MANAAPAVRRMRVFADWVGAGRPLTQTGRLRRADALALVDLLETGDVLDPRFPIHSSGELHWLNLWIEWAKACRLVRVVHGRIVPVGKNAGLLDRPLVLVARILEALPRLGDALGESVVTADAAHTVEAVLGGLVGDGGSLSVDRVRDRLEHRHVALLVSERDRAAAGLAAQAQRRRPAQDASRRCRPRPPDRHGRRDCADGARTGRVSRRR